MCAFLFFFNDTATTEIYTLSLHDALPICPFLRRAASTLRPPLVFMRTRKPRVAAECWRSEEHTSELQSPCNLVCRLLLEKKKKPTPSRGLTLILQIPHMVTQRNLTDRKPL